MPVIVVEAPAKVNLTLDVKYKRQDGYHELESVMHQIGLTDRVTIRPGPPGSIRLRSDNPALPDDRSNLAYQAAQLLLSRYGKGAGVEISIEKNIPLGAGLAGGSSDAAATLWGMNLMFKYELGWSDLSDLASRLGSDVPFCLLGKFGMGEPGTVVAGSGATALARGRGEDLESLPGCFLPWILLVKPDFQISTREVYHNLKPDNITVRPDTPAFLAAWQDCDIMNIAKNLVNVLEPVSVAMHPQIAELKAKMVEYGALRALMSGSGPTVFGIFAEQSRAETARDKFSRDFSEVFLVSSYGGGGLSAGTQITAG